MIKLYSTLDTLFESLLLSNGVSQRSTDFIMMGFGVVSLVCMMVIVIGLIALYSRLLITSYRHMIYEKSPRLRRNWSLIFLITLVVGLVGLITYLG